MEDSKESIRKQYNDKGYIIIDTCLDDELINGARTDLSKYFGENREHPIHVPIAGPSRIQDAWHISQNVLALAESKVVLDTLEILYQAKARPFQTLNFYKGTEQKVHVDSIHFNSEPFGNMCGVWIALEDIGKDQGPLIYYPGSQKLPEMNYDYFDLIADESSYPAYINELQTLIEEHNFKPEYGLIKKGQAIIWSANIMHGGSVQNDKGLTRHSQVTHYYMDNSKCWRPSNSKTKRHYFKPDWVHDVSDEPYRFPLKEAPTSFIGRALGFIRRKIS